MVRIFLASLIAVCCLALSSEGVDPSLAGKENGLWPFSPHYSLFSVERALAEPARSLPAAPDAPIFSDGPEVPLKKDPPPPGVIDGLFRILPLFGIVFFIFYFLVLRPQERKERDHHSFLQNLKVGQSVITIGGIVGKISSIEELVVVLEIAQGVRVRFEKSSLVKEYVGESLISKGGSIEAPKRKVS